MTDFVVLGFPKCGTSALMRMLEELDGVDIERVDGELEAPLYTSDEAADRYEATRTAVAGRIRGHKFVSYVYDPRALRRLAERIPAAVFIVCVREPVRSLVSWREMHRRMALSGTDRDHLVNRDPEQQRFYSQATLDDYYRGFARDRLRYASLIRRCLSSIGSHRAVIVDQAALASDADLVLSGLAAELGLPGSALAKSAAARPTRRRHRGVGDSARNPPLSESVLAELALENSKLDTLLDELGRSPDVRVLRPRGEAERGRIESGLPPRLWVLGSSNASMNAGYGAALRSLACAESVTVRPLAASPTQALPYRLIEVAAGDLEICLIEALMTDSAVVRAGASHPEACADALAAAVASLRRMGVTPAVMLWPGLRRDAIAEEVRQALLSVVRRHRVLHCDITAILERLAQVSGRDWGAMFRDQAHLATPLSKLLATGFADHAVRFKQDGHEAERCVAVRDFSYRPIADCRFAGSTVPIADSKRLQPLKVGSSEFVVELTASDRVAIDVAPGTTLEALVLDIKGSSCDLRIKGLREINKCLRFSRDASDPRLVASPCRQAVGADLGVIEISPTSQARQPTEPSFLADPKGDSDGVLRLAGLVLAGPNPAGSVASDSPPESGSARDEAWWPDSDQIGVLAASL